MSKLLNQRPSIQGKIPSGCFNSLYDFSGSWLQDATETKHLAFDGYFISLYHLHLTRTPLILKEEVKSVVPFNWDPAALARLVVQLLFPSNCNVFDCPNLYELEKSMNGPKVGFVSKWSTQIKANVL